jgi:hypothetical protein
MTTFIHITNQQELDLNLQDCIKLQKQIEKIQKKLNKTIEEYNNKAFSISLCTEEYKNILKTIK